MTPYSRTSVATSTPPQTLPQTPAHPLLSGKDTVGSCTEELSHSSMDLATELIQFSLTSVQQTTHWIQQLQRMNVLSVYSMGETMNSELHEHKQTDAMFQLMTFPMGLVHIQLEEAAKQLACVMQQLFDSELFWIARTVKKTHTTSTADAGSESGATPLAAFEDFQHNYLAMTERWLEITDAAKLYH